MPASAAAARSPDAIDLLTTDHDEIACFLGEYERTYSLASRKALIDNICPALLLHAQLEQEILYPQAKAALKDRRLIAMAEAEHATIRGLVGMLQRLDANDETYQATASILARFVTEHIVAEEQGVFRQLRESDADLVALGGRLATRKAALIALRSLPFARPTGEVGEGPRGFWITDRAPTQTKQPHAA